MVNVRKQQAAHSHVLRSLSCVDDDQTVLQVPLQLAIRETSDAGTPITAGAPDSHAGQIYTSIAEKVYQKLSNMPTQLQPPLLSHD